MLNVCRHRGAKLAEDESGTGQSTLVCRYHGWTYGLSGELQSVRHAAGFPKLDKSCRGLVALPVAERAGLIVVESGKQCVHSATDYASPWFEQLETFALAERQVFMKTSRTVKSNWKLFVETMLEGYHIATLHKASGAAAFNDNVFFFEPLSEPCGRFLIPLRGAIRPDSDDDWKVAHHCAMLYWLFPNTFIFMFGRFVHIIGIFPATIDSCHVTSTALISPSDQEGAKRESFKLLYDWYWSTIDEDVEITETIQACINSGANDDFLIGRFESAIATQLHDHLRRLCETE